jgi:ATP-binding cassette, subfamily B (MDR/TAP), member 8
MRAHVLRLLWTERKLFLMTSGLLITLKPKKKLSYYCDEARIGIEKPPKIIQKYNIQSGIIEIIGILRRHLLLTLAAAGTAVMAAVTSILSPIYVSKLIDSITKALLTSTAPNLTESAGILIGISVANAVLTALYIKLIGDLGEIIAGEMRKELFARLLHESVSFFDDQEIGELLTRLTVDVQSFKHSLKQILTTGIRASVQLTSSTIQMILLSQSLTMSMGAGLPLIFLVGNNYGRYLRKLSTEVRDSEAVTSNRAHETLNNIRTVKAFVNEDYESEKYSQAIEDQTTKQRSLLGHVGIFQGLTIFSMNSLLAAVLYLGGAEVLNGKLSSGGLLAFLMALQAAQKSLTQFVSLNAKWQSMLNDHERISRTGQSKEDLEVLHAGKVPELECRGEIEIKNLTFSHRGRKEILNSADLKIKENEVIGIVGESGSGKSTLIYLLGRLYNPEKGTIFIDGVDAEELDLKWLRRQIGIVPQEPVIFTGTIKENISYGSLEFTSDQVEMAARKAHIHEFISSLPEGYSTQLSKCSMSGGQKQRIAIARALLRSPKILILDEATSALDQKSEEAIHETLREVAGEGKTIIIITHKKGILKMAHKVYSLKDGKFEKIDL